MCAMPDMGQSTIATRFDAKEDRHTDIGDKQPEGLHLIQIG